MSSLLELIDKVRNISLSSDCIILIIITIIITSLIINWMYKERFLANNERINNLKEDNNRLKEKNKTLSSNNSSLTETIHHVFSPLHHEFFFFLRQHGKLENYPRIKNDAKNKMATNILISKLFIWHKNCEIFFENMDKHNSEFSFSSIEKCMGKTVTEVNIFWSKNLLIPDYVISDFNKNHDEKINNLKVEMQELINESSPSDHALIINKFLHRSLLLVRETIDDVEITITNVILKENDKYYKKEYQNPFLTEKTANKSHHK